MEMIIPSTREQLTAGAKAYKNRRITDYQDSVEMRLEVEGRIKGQEFNLDIKVGDKVKIIGQEYESKRNSSKRVFKGKVIFKNKYYIAIQGKDYPTSFKLSEFYTGETKLIKEGQALCN